MEYTQNYHLPQWAETDRIMLPDFNAAMAAIEGGLTADKEAAAAGLAALTAEVGSGGRTCRMAYGSYVGTGNAGPAYPVTLSFPFRPIFVMVCSLRPGAMTNVSDYVRPLTGSLSASPTAVLTVTWGERSISWYRSESDVGLSQNNDYGTTYYYIALGYDE